MERQPETARVLAFRQRQKWTQVQAAEWYGCSERHWIRIENGHAPVPRPLLNRIAEHDVALARGSE